MAVPAYTLVFTVEDAKGAKSSFTIQIPSGIEPYPATLFAVHIAAIVEQLITGGLVDVRFTTPVSVPLWSPSMIIGDVQEKARFVFRTASGFHKSLSLPTALEAIFVPGSRTVDLANPSVAAFIAAMIDGVEVQPGDLVEPCDARGDDITELETATEAWGKVRR